MEVVSKLHDNRISSMNVLVEISIKEYLDLARGILDRNEYQRRPVRSSKTVYSLLLTDLKAGCIIPPLVMAVTSAPSDLNISDIEWVRFLIKNSENMKLLDGLQRTHTMIKLIDELEASHESDLQNRVEISKIRVEFYIGLNRLGILYRMLTLNTGQTPMSLRQQIEMLYLDYANEEYEGIELIRESQERRITKINQYSFGEMIEGFNSYIQRDELPLDRAELLENIQGLEKLSKENAIQSVLNDCA